MRQTIFQKLSVIACVTGIIPFLFVFPVLAEETIKIASIYAHTGTAAKTNRFSIDGIRLGVREINSRGGVLGKELKLIEFDNMSTPIGSKVAADKAVRAKVTAIIGAAWSSHSIAIANVAQAKKIPMISNISTNVKVTRIGDYIFRVCYIDPYQGRVMARFARKDLSAATAAVFVKLTSDYSMGLADEFQKSFTKLNGKVVIELQYKEKQENFHDSILRAKKVAPDVLFIPGHHESGLIIKEAVNSGLSAIPLGGDGWDFESFFLMGGNKTKEGYYCTHWSEDVTHQTSRDFRKKYLQSAHPSAAVALGYDAVLFLAEAIRRAGSIDRNKIRDTLANTRGFQGVTGTISIDDKGDPSKSAVIMKITNGRSHYFKSIDPE